jgi:hypothetical protein
VGDILQEGRHFKESISSTVVGQFFTATWKAVMQADE